MHDGIAAAGGLHHEIGPRPREAADLVALVVVDGQTVALAIAHALHVVARDHDPAFGRNIGTGDHFEQGRLARAIRSHHAHDGGLVDPEVDVEPEGRGAVEQAAAVDFADALQRQQRGTAHCAPPSRRRFSAGSAVSAAASPAQATVPDDRTTTLSATESAISAFCSTTIEAMPSPLRRRTTAMTSSTILGARPWLGSSNSTRPGEPSSARPIATICISPPESVSASRAIRYFSAEKISVTSDIDQARKRVVLMPSARFLATVRVGQRRRSSGTQPIPARAVSCVARRPSDWPSSAISPLRGRVRPRIERSTVVLPAPLAPSSASTSPAATDSETPNRACVSP